IICRYLSGCRRRSAFINCLVSKHVRENKFLSTY
ncbi:hypothetical protein AZ035_002846, partial [Klebsiella aerogenes]